MSGSRGPAKGVVAGVMISVDGAPAIGPACPKENGIAAIVSVVISPKYGLPTTGEDGDGEAVTTGVSTRYVPNDSDPVGCRTNVLVVLPVQGAVRVVAGSINPL